MTIYSRIAMLCPGQGSKLGTISESIARINIELGASMRSTRARIEVEGKSRSEKRPNVAGELNVGMVVIRFHAA